MSEDEESNSETQTEPTLADRIAELETELEFRNEAYDQAIKGWKIMERACKKLGAKNAELREALEPFATVARLFIGKPKSWILYQSIPNIGNTITVGDCLRAKEALEKNSLPANPLPNPADKPPGLPD